MLLTRDQLKDLTGRSQPTAQIRWLRERGWAFQIRADGRPVVSLDEFKGQMCSGSKPQKRVGPNLAALDRVMS
jgi:hypothetical protein